MVLNIVEQNKAITSVTREIAGLKEYFPQCFDSEGSFDIDKFREAIEQQVDVVREGRSYDFLGKSYARMLSSLDTTTVLRPDVEHNSKPENANSGNVYISGDNLYAVRHLLNSYAGQVKCIYIDPPYNTGKDEFVYRDKFDFKAEDLETKLGVSSDEADKILKMTSGNRASHAAWLTFMMPRLLLARDLLSKEGVLFISIDDNEQAYLKQLCDNIYGEANFVGQLIIETATDNNKSQISIEHEYMLCYAKNKDLQQPWTRRSEGAEKIQEEYQKLKRKFGFDIESIQEQLRLWIKKNKDDLPQVTHYDNVDERGVFHDGDIANTRMGGYTYDVIHPVTKKPCKVPEKGFRFPEDTMRDMIKKGDIMFGEDENTLIKPKKRVEDARELLRSVIYEDGRASTKIVDDLVGRGVFDNPKSIKILYRLIDFCTSENDIVLDFFSGSGSTAHAVMNLNKDDGKNRKYIMVQLPELCKETSEAYKAGFRTIDEIGQTRIMRAAQKIKESNPLFAGDLGFKHYIIEEVPQNTLDKLETFDPDTILSTDDTLNMFGRETVLTTWLLRDGYGFGAEAKDIMLGNYKATFCGHHLYMTDSGFSVDNMRELEALYIKDPSFNPDYIVLFGYSFSHNEKELLENNSSSIYSLRDKRPTIDIRY